MTEQTVDKSERKDLSKTWVAALPFYTAIGAVMLNLLLDRLDNTTELVPTHDSASTATFVIAGLCSVLGIVFAVWVWRSLSIWRLVMAAFGCAAASFLLGFLLLAHGMDFWFAWRDFPAGQTRTYSAEIPISRAYATHGKSASFNIQTMPLWSNMDITEQDYRFMQAHRWPADTKRDPDEIPSKGYFCARVTVQATGHAMRVLHAGSTTLPENTVYVCQSTGTMIRLAR